MAKPPHIYLLPLYANPVHLTKHRGATEHSSSVQYDGNGVSIELKETNSLVEDKYSMNIHSASYELEGSTTVKKAMIHHHPRGHEEKHLQFKLQSEHKVIRIILPLLDEEDYKNCIKGFIYTTKNIIEHENKEFDIAQDLTSYFYNDKIEELSTHKNFLLEKIRQASEEGNLLDENDTALSQEELEELKSEQHLLPFLGF